MGDASSSEAHPPRWAERCLRALLRPSDRDCILGDLLEEYRQVVLPTRGPLGARCWYLRQALSVTCDLVPYSPGSVVNSTTLGLVLGLGLSVLIVVTNVVIPVLPRRTLVIRQLVDAVPGSVGWVGLFLLWGIAGSLASRRTTHLGAPVKAGATLAFVSMAFVMLTFVVINNLFLEIVSQQPDKIWGFQHSGYPSMRAYVNCGALKGLVLVLPVLTACGGFAGGIAGRLRRFCATSA